MRVDERAVDPARSRSARAASPFSSARFVPRPDREVDVRRAARPCVARGSMTTSRGGSGPRSRSSTRIHSTVCVSAVLCPTWRIVSQTRCRRATRAGRRSRTSPSAPARRRRAQPRVAVEVVRADPAARDERQGVVVLEEQLAAACRSPSDQLPVVASSSRERSTTRSIASSQLASLELAVRGARAASSAGPARCWPASRKGPSGPAGRG